MCLETEVNFSEQNFKNEYSIKMKNHFHLIALLIVLSTNLTAQNFTGGFNFYLPPDDTAQSAYLPSFPAKALTDQNLVSIDADGHFSVGGNPIRFFGTNFSGNQLFTAKTDVWFVAGRLRKMGFNLVRMIGLDNTNTGLQSLLEYTRRDSVHLNPVALDLMENLIAAFKKNGIYIDIDLFYYINIFAMKGVADADSIPALAGYFDQHIISLNKTFARKVLTHINPYTGKPLWNDPVMASLEITNENSMYKGWHDNKLKLFVNGGFLPYRHVKMLDSLWTAYLKSKYTSTDSLKSAWNIGSGNEQNTEKIRNSGFELSVSTNWKMENWGTGSATLTNDSINAYQGKYSGKVIVTDADGTDWHLPLAQVGLSVTKDSVYQFVFAARADSIRTISVIVSKASIPLSNNSFTLTSQWNLFSFSIRPSETIVNDVRFSFNIGSTKGIYWFDNVSFSGSKPLGLISGESIESGTIRRIDYKECIGFSDQRVKDMSAFYLQLEENYFSSMRSFLKDTIGVKIPIVGNTWNIGVADCAGMSLMDYMDNHSYWDHPIFPTSPWSLTDWHINNTAMANSDGGTITGLMAGVPMVNKPYTISEYNHVFPNRYQTEGVLFITSYASFHDVDAFMLFCYNGGHNVDYNETLDWTTDWNASFFGIDRNTAMLSLVPSCALAYRNGMVDKYQKLIKVQYHPDTYLLYPKIDYSLWGVTPQPYDQKLALEHGVRTASYFADTTTDFSSLPSSPANPYTSDTKQLVWDTTGLFTVSAPGFNAATGFFNSFPSHSFGAITLVSGNDFCTLTWISLDTDSLSTARKSLITISSRVENTNMVWDGIHTLHDKWGTGPAKMQPLTLQMKLHIYADSIVVRPLDTYGNPGSSSKKYFPSSPNMFTVAIDQNVDKTVWFGIDAYGKGGSVSVADLRFAWGYSISRNYPNPFKASTTISFDLPENTFVVLKVFDLFGREVGTLASEELSSGSYTRQWNATNMQEGIYFYRLQAGLFTETKKLILLK
jgi:hypothetical protein